MKIMYISATYGLGGAERSLLDTLIKLKDKESLFVILPSRGMLADKIEEIGVEVVIIPFKTEYGRLGFADSVVKKDIYVTNYKAALLIAEVLRKRQIDLVDINSSVCCVGAMGALLAGIPYIWHIRELLEEHYGMELYDKRLFELLARNAARVVAVSDSVKNVCERRYGLSLIRLYNGLSINKYYVDLKEKRFTNNNFVLAGAISPDKGQITAIKAVQYLVNVKNMKIRLFIVGGGKESYIWALKKYIEEKQLQKYICIMPFCDNLYDLRKSSTYSLTTSKYEALGRVTLEAMLAGNLVIGADTAGTLEIIGNEERGYLYKNGDAISLAESMKRAIYEGDEKRKAVVSRAQKYVKEEFSSDNYIKKLLVVYASAIREASNRKKTDVVSRLVESYNCYLQEDKGMHHTQEQRIDWKLRFELLNKWIQIKQQGKGLSAYFKNNKDIRVGIYGLGTIGCRLYDELEGDGISVKCIIDKQADMFSEIIHVKKPDEEITDIDVLIITIPEQVENIKNMYRQLYSVKLIGISELINSTYH